ncbi:MAG: flagellar biosynthetic protein FliO [Elsteraceae bacterium]
MELTYYFQFVLALLFVLALIWLLAALARRVGLAPRITGARGGPRRLSIVEVLPVDAKRRLVLVRRDGVEHLILLGASADLVVESAIPSSTVGPESPAPAVALSSP